VRYFIRPLRQHYDRVYLVGLSWGGKYALGYGLACPDDVDGLILITPGLRAKVDVDGFTKLAILVAKDFEPESQFVIPIVPEMFTLHPDLLWYIRNDPLRLRSASARFLFESHRLDGYIDQKMPANQLPILLFLASLDPIIDNDKVVDVVRRGGQDVFDTVEYEDQLHSIQLETPGRLVKDMDRWLERRASSGTPESFDPKPDGS
jgi:pimeloyl-ACP methyl ester carboxylesterase